ncbi:MAG: IS66 family transposase [Acidobacteriota bacterium]|nr:IS66 family transposase [Acidobacteriota bacterium]
MNLYSQAHISRIYAQGEHAIVRLVHRLTDNIEDLQAQLIRTPQPVIASLSKELTKVKSTLSRKTAALLRERQLNHQLLRRLRELEREVERGDQQPVERDSHNSSLPPSSDLPWQRVTRTRSLRKKTGMKVGGQFGHQGVTLRQVAQPDQIIIHTPEVCTHCGGAHLECSQAQAFIRRQVFDIREGRVQVTEHRSEARCCAACRAISKAKFPATVRAPVQYGQGVRSRSVYLHLYQLLPVARTSETMRDLFGCSISAATIQRAARVSSGKLIYTEQRIKAALRDSSVIGVDETGLRVAGQGGYIHVARTDELTHYGFDDRRGKAAMDEIGILPQFTGTLVRDGFSSYKWYEQCRHSLCNVHLLRDLVFVEESSPTQKVWTNPLSKLLLKIKDVVADTQTKDEVGLSEKMKNEFLRRYDKLVKKADRLNLPPPKTKAQSDASKKPATQLTPRRLVNRLQRRRDEVLRFMTDTSVPFDNNGSERDLRMVKLQQKISGCFRTPDGARAFCRVRSYLSTARKQGHSLLHSLERVFVGKPLPFHST